MSWFILKHQTDEKTIGVYPQTNGMKPGYNLKKEDSVWNIPFFESPTFLPDFDAFVLDKNAKVTDIISTGLISSTGFLLNKKAMDIIRKYLLPNHIIYPVKLLQKNNYLNDYYWMQFIQDNSTNIDFNLSKLILTHPLPFFRDESILISAKSYSEIENIINSYPDYGLFPDQIKMITDNHLNLLGFSIFYNKYYIDDNLANQLISSNITGIDITNLSELIIV